MSCIGGKQALANEEVGDSEFLPQWLMESHGLKSWQEGLHMMHNPTELADHEEARRRFALQVGMPSTT